MYYGAVTRNTTRILCSSVSGRFPNFSMSVVFRWLERYRSPHDKYARPCNTSVDAGMRHSLSQNLKLLEQEISTARVCLQGFLPPPMAARREAHPHSDCLQRSAPRPNVRTAWSDVALQSAMLRQGERRGVKVRRRHWRDTCKALKPLDWECAINRFRSGALMPNLFLEIILCGWCVRHTVSGVSNIAQKSALCVESVRWCDRERLSSGGRIDVGAMGARRLDWRKSRSTNRREGERMDI